MLEQWLRAVAEAIGATPTDPSLLGEEAVGAILEISRIAAHQVTRPAAPLTAFALGLALGRFASRLEDLEALAAEVATLAATWGESGPTAPVG